MLLLLVVIFDENCIAWRTRYLLCEIGYTVILLFRMEHTYGYLGTISHRFQS